MFIRCKLEYSLSVVSTSHLSCVNMTLTLIYVEFTGRCICSMEQMKICKRKFMHSLCWTRIKADLLPWLHPSAVARQRNYWLQEYTARAIISVLVNESTHLVIHQELDGIVPPLYQDDLVGLTRNTVGERRSNTRTGAWLQPHTNGKGVHFREALLDAAVQVVGPQREGHLEVLRWLEGVVVCGLMRINNVRLWFYDLIWSMTTWYDKSLRAAAAAGHGWRRRWIFRDLLTNSSCLLSGKLYVFTLIIVTQLCRDFTVPGPIATLAIDWFLFCFKIIY